MEIKKLLGRNVSGFGNGTAADKIAANSEAETALENYEAAKSSGEDTVRVSSLARQLSQISTILNGDDLERRARVDDIKRRVQDGSYNVDSRDVARSIISFTKDLPAVDS
jgi:flagellar biosynthesis anti-sigma factor FlgM